MLLWLKKRVRVYRLLFHVWLKMAAKSLKLVLQLPHQRNAVVGSLPDVLSDEKRRHRSAVLKWALFTDPISVIAKVHSQWESQSWKIHRNFSFRKIDYYFIFIY